VRPPNPRRASLPNDRPATPLPAALGVDKIPGGHVVRDANGQALAYVYSRADPTEATRCNGTVGERDIFVRIIFSEIEIRCARTRR
jgi:hypothetical protein